MKTFLTLALIVCCLGQLTPVMANFQAHTVQTENVSRQSQKTYISLDRIHFSEEGIFLYNDANLWTRVEQLSHDSQGYYVAPEIFRQRHYIAKCNNCGKEYQNRCPQPCESCDESKGFDLVYIEDSYWD